MFHPRVLVAGVILAAAEVILAVAGVILAVAGVILAVAGVILVTAEVILAVAGVILVTAGVILAVAGVTLVMTPATSRRGAPIRAHPTPVYGPKRHGTGSASVPSREGNGSVSPAAASQVRRGKEPAS
jgi:hypothetical protein